MADTFSNDLRLRLQESGSNAGTWGDLLNGTITNIASALGQGSEAIPNASTHTITLADGTADEARSLYLKCTGGGQACTVTLGPNTISKVWIIDNATSYTLTFSQGSGANVAIAAGAVKVIATDGAGSGAAVVDTLAGLEGSLSTLAVTGTATMGGLVTQATANSYTAGAAQIKSLAGDISYITNVSGSFLITNSSTTDQFTLSSAGAVGIGTSSPNIANFGKALTITDPATSNQIPAIELAFGSNTRGANIAVDNRASVKALAITAVASDLSMTFGTNNTERMRIDGATGKVVVGNVPGQTFAVLNARRNGAAIEFGHGNNGAGYYGTAGSYGNNGQPYIGFSCDAEESANTFATRGAKGNIITGDLSGNLTFAQITTATGTNQSPQNRMTLNASGSLLVNSTTATTATKFQATGAGGTFAGTFVNAFGNAGYGVAISSGSGEAMYFYHGGTIVSPVGRIVTSSSATSYITSSDYRLKENVVAMSGATERLKQLNPSRFNFIADADTTVDGFLAHEVQDVVPEAITGTKDAVDADGNPDYQGIDQSKLVPLLVATIQELEARLTALENN